jgi:hypothetical protein
MDPSAEVDTIADAIATEVAERIAASHPAASGEFLRRLVALYTAQAVGRAPAPGRITAAELAAWLETSPQRIHDAYSSGLARAWQAYRTRWPDDVR